MFLIAGNKVIGAGGVSAFYKNVVIRVARHVKSARWNNHVTAIFDQLEEPQHLFAANLPGSGPGYPLSTPGVRLRSKVARHPGSWLGVLQLPPGFWVANNHSILGLIILRRLAFKAGWSQCKSKARRPSPTYVLLR